MMETVLILLFSLSIAYLMLAYIPLTPRMKMIFAWRKCYKELHSRLDKLNKSKEDVSDQFKQFLNEVLETNNRMLKDIQPLADKKTAMLPYINGNVRRLLDSVSSLNDRIKLYTQLQRFYSEQSHS